MRLIDGDAKIMAQFYDDEYEDWIVKEITVADYLSFSDTPIPFVDAVPVVHGNWITKEYMYGDPDFGLADMWVDRLAESTDYYAECSVCGKNAGYDGEGSLILSDFCPSCGAKMDGGAEE